MREIKFRLWTYDEDEKRNVMMEVSFGSYVPDEIMASSQVMQYTGLKDKNGKEIYEGDILLNLGAVEFGDYFVFSGEYGDRNEYHFGWHTIGGPLVDTNELEVIGNIYENPELL